MKKRLASLLMMIVMVVFGAALAEAAESGTIGVTVTITQSLDIAIDQTAWAVGAVGEGTPHTTWDDASPGFFGVTNDGNSDAYVDIKGTIVGGCSIGASAGTDTFRIGHGQATGTPPNTVEPASYTAISDTDSDLATVSPTDTYRFDLQLQTPTSTTFGGVEQTITLTITAKAL